jgi:hypothetical protein
MKPLQPYLLSAVLFVAVVCSVIGWSNYRTPEPEPHFTAAAIATDSDSWSEYNLRTEQANMRRLMTDLKMEIRSLPPR